MQIEILKGKAGMQPSKKNLNQKGPEIIFFSFNGGPLYDILVIGGTVLEVLAPVSPCHSLVQNFMDSVCNIF